MANQSIYYRQSYCGNCWESLRADGTHRPEQPCREPSAPLTYDQLGDAIRAEVLGDPQPSAPGRYFPLVRALAEEVDQHPAPGQEGSRNE
jgi:hypothetical protein